MFETITNISHGKKRKTLHMGIEIQGKLPDYKITWFRLNVRAN